MQGSTNVDNIGRAILTQMRCEIDTHGASKNQQI